VSVLADDQLLSPDNKFANNYQFESRLPGKYALVIEGGAFPKIRSAGFCRKVLTGYNVYRQINGYSVRKIPRRYFVRRYSCFFRCEALLSKLSPSALNKLKDSFQPRVTTGNGKNGLLRIRYGEGQFTICF